MKNIKTQKKREPSFVQTNVMANLGNEKMDRAQIWSIDVLLAVVIFISIMIIFYATISAKEKPAMKDLQTEAKMININLEKNQRFGFIGDNGVINSTKLDNLTEAAAANYQDVKENLNVRGDFCIYFEDEQGNIVTLKNNVVGIGDGNITIDGIPCGKPYN